MLYINFRECYVLDLLERFEVTLDGVGLDVGFELQGQGHIETRGGQMTDQRFTQLFLIATDRKPECDPRHAAAVGGNLDLAHGLRIGQGLAGVWVNISPQSGAQSVYSGFVGHVEP